MRQSGSCSMRRIAQMPALWRAMCGVKTTAAAWSGRRQSASAGYVLVNSAGIYREGALEDLREEELDDLLDCNVKGVFHLTQAALPALKASRGAVVNVASDAGVHGNYFCAAYCASKGAVVLFTRALALETAAFGVRVNAIAPGDILTPLTEAQLGTGEKREQSLREMASVYPLGRIGTAEEAAALIVFLASARASFVTGAVYGIDGGLTA